MMDYERQCYGTKIIIRIKMKLSVPHINHKDLVSVNKLLKTEWISTSSKIVDDFERKLSRICGTKYSVALNSGTSAIHLGLKIFGVDNKCEVIVPSLTFIATVNPILYLGANPVIFDVDRNHNLKIDDVIDFIKNKTVFKNQKTINKLTKKVIKAVIVTHMWGRECEFHDLKILCKKRKIFILEDAAEALGSYTKKNRFVHCGSLGDVGCISFNANKIITTGSGGAIITNNKKFYSQAQYLSNQAKDDTFNYIHNTCGYNYKMNGLCASLGISQLKRLKQKIRLRKKIYNRYIVNFRDVENIELLHQNSNYRNNYWLSILYFKKLNYKQVNKLSLLLSKKKIETRRVWRPLNLQSYLKNCQCFKIVNANKFYSRSLCIPSDDNISLQDVDKISNMIKKIYGIISNN